MKKILLLLLVMLTVRMTFAQVGKGLSNTVDNLGNCYVTGIVNNGMNGVDILIVKYDANGDTLWTNSYSGTDINLDDQGVVIKAASNGDVYVAGNIGVLGQDYDVVLLKYSSTGSFLWEQHFPQINTAGTDKAMGLAVDQYDNAYVTGFRTYGNHTQMFTTKCGPNFGTVRWVRFENGPDNMNSCGNAIVIAHSGNICVTGYTTTSTGGIDMITQEYMPMYGNRPWQSAAIYNGGANAEDKAFGIAVDETDNIYIVGYASNFTGTSNTDIALVKYNPTGGWVWTATYNGNNNGTTDNKAFGIAVDETDNIYITGYAGTPTGGRNYITLMYNPAGSKLWNTTYAGSGIMSQAVSIGLIKDNGTTVGVVVTGSSVNADTLSDYVTVGYDITSGAVTNQSTYSLDSTSNDVAMQLAVSPDGTVFVTGFSQVIINAKVTSSFKTQTMKWGHGNHNSSIGNVPKKFALFQNYPNPFNPSTVIKFDLSKDATVKLTVYDMLGKQVSVLIDGYLRGGSHEIQFSGTNLSSGIYFYELKTSVFREVRKMSLIK